MIEKDGNRYRVTAPMLIANARALLETGCAIVRGESVNGLSIDLSAVQDVDSSALAVIFGWMRIANTRGTKLRVANPPASLLSLAGLYGVSDTLPLA